MDHPPQIINKAGVIIGRNIDIVLTTYLPGKFS
jgi:hypothetical protein